jgi:hypothetical protein
MPSMNVTGEPALARRVSMKILKLLAFVCAVAGVWLICFLAYAVYVGGGYHDWRGAIRKSLRPIEITVFKYNDRSQGVDSVATAQGRKNGMAERKIGEPYDHQFTVTLRPLVVSLRTTLAQLNIRNLPSGSVVKVDPASFKLRPLRKKRLFWGSDRRWDVGKTNQYSKLVLVVHRREGRRVVYKDLNVKLDQYPPWRLQDEWILRDVVSEIETLHAGGPAGRLGFVSIPPGTATDIDACFVCNNVQRAALEFDVEVTNEDKKYKCRAVFEA